MARWLNSSIPGIVVPEALLLELDATAAGDEVTKGIEIAGRVINALRPYCAGVHIMAMGWEQHIVSILDAGGVKP
jgi:methylenetetrahydrofolate reductase (NADPH)